MIIYNSELYHYGVPRRSGRYKWGSGKNPFHHGADGGARKIKRLEKKANRMATMASMNKRAASDANNPFRSVNNINAKYYGRKASKYNQRLENAKTGNAYKQTAEYKAARRKKIAAIAAGTTVVAAGAYLATHPEARQMFRSKSRREVDSISKMQDNISAEWDRLKNKSEQLKKEAYGNGVPRTHVDRVEVPRTHVGRVEVPRTSMPRSGNMPKKGRSRREADDREALYKWANDIIGSSNTPKKGRSRREVDAIAKTQDNISAGWDRLKNKSEQLLDDAYGNVVPRRRRRR